MGSEVPCDGCTLCCQKDAVRLLPQDDLGLYMKENHPLFPGQYMLAHKENGDCLYLDREKGCTIHPFRPTLCRDMDCRNIYKSLTPKKAQKLNDKGMLNEAIYNRGKELS